MKISKKLLSVVLSLIMVFSAVAVCSVTASADVTFPEYDATKTSLVIGTPQAKQAGQKVTVPVSIENNTGLWAVNIQLAYDATNLSVASTGAVTAGGVLTGFCDYSVADGVITVYIEQAGNEFVNTTANGVVFNVAFTVVNHKVGAIHPIDFTHKDRYSVIEAQSGAEVEGLTFKNGGIECVQNKITPAQVTGLKVTRTAMYSAKLTWSAAKNAKSYEVYRRIGSSGSWSKVKTTTSRSYTNTFTKTANGKYVYYKVRAISSTSTAGKYSSEKYVKVMGTVKAAISKITVPAKKTLTVYAKAVKNASGYQYQVALNKKFKSGLKSAYTTAKSKKFTKLSAKKTYYVRIRAYQTIGGKKVYGSWSTVKYKKTK